MNSSSIIILFLITGYFVIYFFLKHNKSRIKGGLGERKVANYINRLDRNTYKSINNLYLRSGNGSTQIDHLIISVYGIFVIETKAYSGWIHGYESAEYWSQTFYNKKTKFFNPIKQNESHIKFLKSIMANFRWVPYHSIIVFTGKAELKNIGSDTPVIYGSQLLKIIKKYDEPILSIDQMDNYLKQLSPYFTTEKHIKKEHVNNVRTKISQRKKNIKHGICPNCKGELVLRTGKYGKFYGCSNFPRCNFTTN